VSNLCGLGPCDRVPRNFRSQNGESRVFLPATLARHPILAASLQVGKSGHGRRRSRLQRLTHKTYGTSGMPTGIFCNTEPHLLGALLAALTSLSPQLQKAMPRNTTSHLSLKMLVALSAGLCLWIVYGVLKEDWVIMLANSIGAILSLAVLGLKNSRLEFMLSRAQPNILFKRAARKSLRQRR
jgi:MtN3 and saliva related transmembrane protein